MKTGIQDQQEKSGFLLESTPLQNGAGMTNLKNNNELGLLTKYKLAPCAQHSYLWVEIRSLQGEGILGRVKSTCDFKPLAFKERVA